MLNAPSHLWVKLGTQTGGWSARYLPKICVLAVCHKTTKDMRWTADDLRSSGHPDRM